MRFANVILIYDDGDGGMRCFYLDILKIRSNVQLNSRFSKLSKWAEFQDKHGVYFIFTFTSKWFVI